MVAIPAVYVLQVPPAPELPEILTSTVVPLTANVFPSPMKLSWVIPAPIWTPPDWIPTSEAPLRVPITSAPVLVVFNLVAFCQLRKTELLCSQYMKVWLPL